jgi:cytochrome bd ubiquinol oxidase subunit II
MLVATLSRLQFAFTIMFRSLTIYNAASSPKTLWIMLLIVIIGMPFVLTYTLAVYWTFRGRVESGEHGY